MLAGQPAVYLVQEMRNYSQGVRKDTSKSATMTRFLKELSEQDFEDIAAFFEQQKRY